MKALRARVASHTQSEVGLVAEVQHHTAALAAAASRLAHVREELAKATAELADLSGPEAAREPPRDDRDGLLAPALLQAFAPLKEYAHQVMQAPTGHLPNLMALQDALEVMQAQAAAAAQAARVEEHKRAQDAEYAILMGLQPEGEGTPSEAAAAKKAKPSEQAAAADEVMDLDGHGGSPSDARGSASPGRGAG